MKSLTVYTSIFGQYDALQPVKHPGDANYVCFTDEPVECDPWDVRVFETDADDDPFWNAKYYKILAHEVIPWTVSEVTMWIDGNVQIKKDPQKLVDDVLGDHAIVAVKHPHRDCLYDEAKACIRIGKGDESEIRAQAHHYRAQGFPEHWGLWHCAVLIRRNTLEVKGFERAWWEELARFSSRDQISFPYLVRRFGIDVGTISQETFGEYFHWGVGRVGGHGRA